jgi:deazaflavin-dependent oxidoreductase (nitroreductase family)
MSEVQDWNSKIIEEFRANEGRVRGPFAGAPVLLLHTIGAKTRLERVNPMMYADLDGHRYVFATKAGADTNPDWYWNLVAHPDETVEVGTETYEAAAVPVTGDDRDRIYAEQARQYQGFAEYEKKTSPAHSGRRTHPQWLTEHSAAPEPPIAKCPVRAVCGCHCPKATRSGLPAPRDTARPRSSADGPHHAHHRQYRAD